LDIQIDMISQEHMREMTTMEKIRFILDEVQKGKIVILESGLSPDEEAKLIETTMLEIATGDFTGIEIESYPPSHEKSGVLGKIFKKTPRSRLTIIGPANKMKTIKKDHKLISAIIMSKADE
jgi:hypothetical protein